MLVDMFPSLCSSSHVADKANLEPHVVHNNLQPPPAPAEGPKAVSGWDQDLKVRSQDHPGSGFGDVSGSGRYRKLRSLSTRNPGSQASVRENHKQLNQFQESTDSQMSEKRNACLHTLYTTLFAPIIKVTSSAIMIPLISTPHQVASTSFRSL